MTDTISKGHKSSGAPTRGEVELGPKSRFLLSLVLGLLFLDSALHAIDRFTLPVAADRRSPPMRVQLVDSNGDFLPANTIHGLGVDVKAASAGGASATEAPNCDSDIARVDYLLGSINGALSMYFADNTGNYPVPGKAQDVSRYIARKYIEGSLRNPWGEPYYYVGDSSSYIIFTRINYGRGCSASTQAWRLYSSATGRTGYTTDVPRVRDFNSSYIQYDDPINADYQSIYQGSQSIGQSQAALSAGIY